MKGAFGASQTGKITVVRNKLFHKAKPRCQMEAMALFFALGNTATETITPAATNHFTDAHPKKYKMPPVIVTRVMMGRPNSAEENNETWIQAMHFCDTDKLGYVKRLV